MKKMFGVNVPISAPMTEDQRIDCASLENLCEFLIEKGVHGLYPNGSTGEMAYLSAEERKQVLECCVKANKGRVQVFSMVGAPTTEETIDLPLIYGEAQSVYGSVIAVVFYEVLYFDQLCILLYYCIRLILVDKYMHRIRSMRKEADFFVF